jgi:hypothetical protein
MQYPAKHPDPIKPFACGGKALLRQRVGGSDLRQKRPPAAASRRFRRSSAAPGDGSPSATERWSTPVGDRFSFGVLVWRDETATRGTGCRLAVKHATRQPGIRAGGLVRRDRAIRQSPWTTAASDAYVASGDAIKFVVAQNFGIEFGLGHFRHPLCLSKQRFAASYRR